MQKLLILFVCVYASTAHRSYGQFRLAQQSQPRPGSKAIALDEIINGATMKILQALYEESWDKSVVSSPLSLMTLLSIYHKGAGSFSQAEINDLLSGGFYVQDQISELYKDLAVQLADMNYRVDYLNFADKISISNQFSLNKNFISNALDYHCEVDTLDFSKPYQAAANINRWAAEKTHGLISSPVPPGILKGAVAALYNVIYFRGHWNVPFKANETTLKVFHLNRNEVVRKPTMHLYGSFKYAESTDLDAKALILPYREDGFSMLVILPNQVDGLPSLLNKLADGELYKIFDNMTKTKDNLNLQLPKFYIRTKMSYKSILQQVGVSSIFTEPAPGVANNAKITVSHVLQEAFIKVDEEGSTAGAFTVMPLKMLATQYGPEPLEFIADHPFIYAVLYFDKMLFAGTYSGD